MNKIQPILGESLHQISLNLAVSWVAKFCKILYRSAPACEICKKCYTQLAWERLKSYIKARHFYQVKGIRTNSANNLWHRLHLFAVIQSSKKIKVNNTWYRGEIVQMVPLLTGQRAPQVNHVPSFHRYLNLMQVKERGSLIPWKVETRKYYPLDWKLYRGRGIK